MTAKQPQPAPATRSAETEGLTRPTSPPPPFKYPLGYRPPATSPMPEVPPAPPKADSDIFDRIAALEARVVELETRFEIADNERWSNDE